MKIKGKFRFVDKDGNCFEYDGLSILPDDTKFQSLNLTGSLWFKNIFCDTINVNGKCEGFSLTAQNSSFSGKTEIDKVKVAQILKVEGNANFSSVEAEEIFLESRTGSIKNVKCQSIKVSENAPHPYNVIIKIFSSPSDGNSRVQLKNIDAGKVNLENCEVDEIKCKDAVIGTNCLVKNLFVDGECKIDANAEVINLENRL